MLHFDGFSQKDTIEQIILLDEIKDKGDKTILPELFEIYSHPTGDHAVDEMVYHTLFHLLHGETNEIVKGLHHASHDVQLISIRSAAETHSAEVMESLLDLLAQSQHSDIIAETLRALTNFNDTTLVPKLAPFILHEDCAIMAGATQALMSYKDKQVRNNLIQLIEESDEVQGSESGCSLRTAIAINSLSQISDQQSIEVLVSYIHHHNPSFRRETISSLASMDEVVLPALSKCLEQGDNDEKIMAANIIGVAGHKSGADIAVDFLTKVDDQNLKFALYEALGRIDSLRSLAGLSDGLKEENELVLMAVITGLENLFNQSVVHILVQKVIDTEPAQLKQILKGIIASRALKIFIAFYQEGTIKAKLMSQLMACRDHEAMNLFRGELSEIESELAEDDISKLTIYDASPQEKKILAADDSKTMLFFYKGVAADLGVEIVTVEDGRQALDQMKVYPHFDLIIIDMNMPNMDGIELAREIRKQDQWRNLPLLMATAESKSSQAQIAKDAGINNFITKPFTKEDFKAKVAEMI